MSDSLKSFASFNENNEVQITVGKQTFTVNAHFDGETCWERCHPTFISKKRKVILTCPRKVGHSSIRFYLNAQNEMLVPLKWLCPINRSFLWFCETPKFRDLSSEL